jgi:hypothetical protein
MSDTLTVYWAPANYMPSQQSMAMLYRKPEKVFTNLHQEKIPGSLMSQCPAVKDTLDNVFVFKSAIDDEFDIPDHCFEREPSIDENPRLNVDSIAGMYHERPTSFPDQIDVIYNLGWLFFASEPVVARFTAPYFPTHTPMEGARLSPGEFNIGKWYRSWNLDYHIPKTTRKFSIKEDDPLFFLEIMTNKKVVFKRYTFNESLLALTREATNSPNMYGRHKTLDYRYDMAAKSLMPEMVLAEIRKNLVE